MFEEANGQYTVPSRYLLSQEIDEVMSTLKKNIMPYILNVRRINICTDLWSKKGMTASFIGVTAHFFSEHQRHNVTLAVRQMPSPHTADNILIMVKLVLADWNIPLNKVGNTITDNGSNMIKAFKEEKADYNEAEGEQATELDKDEMELDDDDDDDDDESEKEDKDKFNKTIEDEMEEFDINEDEHQTMFASFNRISCFAHSLQLVVQFDKITPFQKSTSES